jgi:hypothetical protein
MKYSYPYENASWLSKIFFWWLIPVDKYCNSNFDAKTFPYKVLKNVASVNVIRFQKFWNLELKKKRFIF